MIEFMSSWVKGIGLAIVIISILEMLLPNNKTKKYIRMVMGMYLLFTMIAPLINDQEIFDLNHINIENYVATQASSTVDQSSMNERIQELYIQELEKDITKKIEEKGYQVITCKVKAQISDIEEETKITKIKLKVEKAQEEKNKQKEDIENQVVTQIQKIKPVNTTINKTEETEQEDSAEDKSTKVKKSDLQDIKKFLIEEYEVNEKCLEIN